MRKSVELRLSQTRELIEAYLASGLTSDRSYNFMNDMVCRLEQGKGISKGQRSYLDSLIDQGVPKPKNEAKVNEVLAAAEVDGMQDVKSTLSDFAFKIGKGWDLSEKQEKFLANLFHINLRDKKQKYQEINLIYEIKRNFIQKDSSKKQQLACNIFNGQVQTHTSTKR